METIDVGTGRAYRVNYRKLRIAKITDLRASHKLLVEAYFSISYNQRINLKGFIPYDVLANESRNKRNIDFIMTHDAAINLIDNVILKMPVGVSSSELSIFEHNMLNAVCRTFVMANPRLSVNDIRTATPSIIALIERIKENGYYDISIPLWDIAKTVGKDEVETEMELWSCRPFVSIRSINGIDMVSASAELVSLFYDVSNRPRFSEKDIVDEEYYFDSSESDIANDEDWGYEVPEDIDQGRDFPENLWERR